MKRQWNKRMTTEGKETLYKDEGANKITVSYWRRQGRNGGNSVGKTDPALSLYRAALWERNPRHICQSQTSQTTTGKNTGTLTQLLTVSPDRPQQLLSDRHTHTHTHTQQGEQSVLSTTAEWDNSSHRSKQPSRPHVSIIILIIWAPSSPHNWRLWRYCGNHPPTRTPTSVSC